MIDPKVLDDVNTMPEAVAFSVLRAITVAAAMRDAGLDPTGHLARVENHLRRLCRALGFTLTREAAPVALAAE